MSVELSTLIAVPLRVAEGLAGNPPPDDDRRLFGTELLSRVGAIGGSPVAEGYHNFGTAGAVGLLAAIGLIIAGLDRLRVRAVHDAILGVVLLPLLTDVRNFFAVVPAQVTMGLVLVGVALLLPKQTRAASAIARARERDR